MAETATETAEDYNKLPDPTTFAAPPHTGKKRHKKPPHAEGELGVSINSLLDVLSVILVFLMKSYSANSVQIKPSPDLQAPNSHSMQVVMESTAVVVTLKDILVDDIPIVRLEDGVVPESEQGEGGSGIINSLREKLQEELNHNKKVNAAVGKPVDNMLMTVISDRYVPISLITKVMVTAGNVGFNSYNFAAIKRER